MKLLEPILQAIVNFPSYLCNVTGITSAAIYIPGKWELPKTRFWEMFLSFLVPKHYTCVSPPIKSKLLIERPTFALTISPLSLWEDFSLQQTKRPLPIILSNLFCKVSLPNLLGRIKRTPDSWSFRTF